MRPEVICKAVKFNILMYSVQRTLSFILWKICLIESDCLFVGWNFKIIPGRICLGNEWNRKLCSLILFVFSSLESRVCNLNLQRIPNEIFEILYSVHCSVFSTSHHSGYKIQMLLMLALWCHKDTAQGINKVKGIVCLIA